MDRRSLVRVSLAASVALVLGGCAGIAVDPQGSPPTFPTPFPTAPVEVQGLGTVLDEDGSPELCLGAVAESYPPQCSGLPIAGWDWDAVDGEEIAGEVTWGAYAVWGEWNGHTLTLTREPVLAALHDPAATPLDPNPWDEGLPAGPLSEADAVALQAQLPDVVPGLLATTPVNGRLVVQVIFDDGTLQAEFDERYGDDAVVVISSLQPLE